MFPPQNGCELYVENGGGTDKEITCHADITTSAKRVRRPMLEGIHTDTVGPRDGALMRGHHFWDILLSNNIASIESRENKHT